MDSETIIRNVGLELNLYPFYDQGVWSLYNGKTHIDLQVIDNSAKVDLYLKEISEDRLKKLLIDLLSSF